MVFVHSKQPRLITGAYLDKKMDKYQYAMRLRALHQELGELHDLATTEKDLQQLQAVLLNWHANALAKEVRQALTRQSREVCNRSMLLPAALEVLG